MKIVRYFALIVFVYAVAPQGALGQKVSGKWYGVGYIDVEQSTNDYLCELLITQDGSTISGEFNYFFRNGYFSNKLKGTFKVDNRYMYISLLPIMYNQTVNTLLGVDCPMHGEFTLRVSRTETSLTGNFLSDDLHKYTCAPLKVSFVKVPDTDPTLKERLAQQASDTTDDADDDDADSVIAKTAIAPVVHDTAKIVATSPVLVPPPAVAKNAVAEQAERSVTLRAVDLVRVLDVVDDSVRIELYDNAVLDYDTISVFYNKKLVEHNRLLQTREPIRFFVHVDTAETKNDLVMYAENLGLLPPNSAVMIVTDKSHRYEVSLTSDYQKSAGVRLRKVQKPIVQQ